MTNQEKNNSPIEFGPRIFASVDKKKGAEIIKLVIDVLTMVRRTHLLESGYDWETAIALSDGEKALRYKLFEDGHEIEAFLSTLSVNDSGYLGLEFVQFQDLMPNFDWSAMPG